jgi:hypothetical protein
VTKTVVRTIQACFANDHIPDQILGQRVQQFGAAGARRPATPQVQAVRVPEGFLRAGNAGKVLPPVVQRAMEKAFGADLSDVRIHVGNEAARLGARAITVGSNIYFSPDAYQPQTPAGKQLLGRAVSHVLQQRTGRVTSPFTSGTSVVRDPELEAEAATMAERVAGTARGAQAVPGGAMVQRAADYRLDVKKAKKDALRAASLQGTCTFTLKSGKKTSNAAVLFDPKGNSYIDITSKPFPSAIDMKNVTGITFTPHLGKEREYSTWSYLYNAGWLGPRFTTLG